MKKALIYQANKFDLGYIMANSDSWSDYFAYEREDEAFQMREAQTNTYTVAL